ncbi:MAG: InlB B-repeat-containing protein [Candidatus Limivicinus sp.]|nr:InlB B-repeat-containing protein [Candidatus Limivicinus sp.]
MKQIRKLLALVLACLALVLALPSTALAANRGEPAGYVSQVNSAFTMPKPGQALPTTATNYVADTIVTAAWEPSGNVAVDQTYTCKVRLVLGDGDGYPIYVYAQSGYIDIGINYPSGHYESLVSQSFADNPGIAWQIDQNYVSNTSTWVWGTVNYSLSVTPYHSINYNTNGGTITSTGYPTYVADGDSVSQSSLPTAKKTGYVFKGWEWDYDKGLILGNLSSALSAVYGPVYLKAVWETKPVNYVLSYNANGGSGSMASQTVTEGQAAKLKTNAFTKTGYYFTGWNTKANGSGTAYSDGAYATFYGNTTLYAQWQKYADTVITFDKNDGSGTTVTQTVPYGESATLNANSFTRTGYTFSGWNTKADGSGTAYGDGASISPSSDVTLYAQWQLNTYSYSFDANGGSGSMSGGSAAYGESIQLPGNSFTRPKYTFTGWNTRADGNGTAYADNASLTLTENTTLYAQWILVTDYTILLPDGDNITVDPETKIGSAQIGIQAGSTISEEKQLQMSVNAGTHYDDAAQCYRLLNNTGGQLLFYALAYKGNEVNPGNARGGVLLETADSDAVFAGFQNRVSVTVGTARTAGRYTDALTFRFALV